MLRLPPDLWLTVVALVFVGAGMLLLICAVFSRRPRTRTCPRCRYDLSGVPGRTCPECGRTARSERQLFRRRRSRRRAAAATILVVLGGAPLLGPSVAARAPGYTPDIVLYWMMPSLELGDPLYNELSRRLYYGKFAASAQTPGPLTMSERLLLQRCVLVLARGERSSDWLVDEAEYVLREFDARAATVVPQLLALLEHPEPKVRRKTVRLLGNLNRDSNIFSLAQYASFMESVSHLLMDVDPEVRDQALSVVTYYADWFHEPIPEALVAMWDRETSSTIRKNLISSMGLFTPSPDGDRILEEALSMYGSDRRGLADLAGRPPVSDRAQAVLERLAGDSDDTVRRQALQEWAGNGASNDALFAQLCRLAEEDCKSYPNDFDREGILTTAVLRAGPTEAACGLLRVMMRSPQLWQGAVIAAESLGPASHALLPDLRRARESIHDWRFAHWECPPWHNQHPDAPERLEALIRTLEALEPATETE